MLSPSGDELEKSWPSQQREGPATSFLAAKAKAEPKASPPTEPVDEAFRRAEDRMPLGIFVKDFPYWEQNEQIRTRIG